MNNFIIATRVLLKNKFYSAINILGLAVALSVAMIILLYVQNDMSYDKQHSKHEQIYRVDSRFNINGKDDTYALASQFLPYALKQDYPEVINYTRFRFAGKLLFEIDDRKFYENNFYFADSSLFSVFDYKLLEGDPKTVLDEPNSVILTQSTAKKHFGNSSAMGEVMKTPTGQYKVTGILEDLPDNVHMPFDGLMSYISLERAQGDLSEQEKLGGLWSPSDFSFLLLPTDYDPQTLTGKFPEFYAKYMEPFARMAGFNGSFSAGLTKLSDIHFDSNPPQFDLATGNKTYAYAFTAIGIFILVLASINYMNLASARSVGRSKEVGIRKVLGSSKSKLIGQFLSESIIISFLSLILAFGLTALIVNGIGTNNLMGKVLIFDPLSNMPLTLGALSVTLLIGLLSGIYPAFYLSATSTISALKGVTKTGPGSLLMRKILVVFQFFISVGVITSTLLMKNQIDFINDKDLGFNKDNVVIVQLQDTSLNSRIEVIKSELTQNPNIVGVTDAVVVGGDTNLGNNLIGASKSLLRMESIDSVSVDESYPVLFVGDDYVATMQMELVDGRAFDKNLPSDQTQSVMVNEAMVKKMGWDNPIGRKAGFPFMPQSPKVIGVVKDFNAFSLHSAIEPTIIFHKNVSPFLSAQPGWITSLHIHINGKATRNAMDHIENVMAEQNPNSPFEYRFLDTRAEELYRDDIRQSKLTGLLSYICIFISCLGLLGLASFSTSQRIKEIGVRKVLGATIKQLVYLIFKDILWLVILGFVISVPVAYYVINQWLQVFEYTMNLNQTIVIAALLSGTVAVLIAFLTVSFHSVKAASQNPVKALRYE